MPLATVVTPAITSSTLFLVAILIHVERKCGLITSGVLFIYWFLLVTTGIVESYTLIIHVDVKMSASELANFSLFFIMYGFIIIEFILFCFAEWRPPEYYMDRAVCPEFFSSFLSRITFWWMNRLLITGYKKTLEEKDVWALAASDRSVHTISAIEASWRRELKRCKWACRGSMATDTSLSLDSPQAINYAQEDNEETPLLLSPNRRQNRVTHSGGQKKVPSLFRAMVKVYCFTLVRAHLCKLVYDVLIFLGPALQSLLIDFTENKDEEQWKGILYAVAFFLLASFNSFMFHQLFHIGLFLGMRVRSGVVGLIYKKALVLGNTARKDTTVGEIVNLMSVDAQRLQDVTGYLWMVWSSPFQVVIAVWLLWRLLGPSVLAGLAVMILLIPANLIIGSRQQKLQVVQMQQKDGRIKLMNELLNGIKVLKLYAWEVAFGDKVSAIRDKELTYLRSYSLLAGIGSFSWSMATFFVMLATFATYVLLGHHLDAKTAFVALSLFNILYFPINLLPLVISSLVTASVSVKRLANFLRQEELDPDCVNRDSYGDKPVEISRGSFTWGASSSERTILDGINFQVNDGSLVAVIGSVGSGKSSLISAILGEMDKRKGSVNLRGKVAYVSQQAWIQNATLKDNILFGKPYDPTRYKDVIQACALGPDLEILPGGDGTEIGEKGINLSGGQKQRVSLARAVYNDADIYLMDDPLSAVDSHVGKHIFDHILGEDGLLKYKTRVLVTNALHFLPRTNHIYVLENGRISESGTYDELLERDQAFAQFLRTYLLDKTKEEKGDREDNADEEEDKILSKQDLIQRMESVISTSAGSSDSGRSPTSGAPGGEGITERPKKIKKKKGLQLHRSLSKPEEPLQNNNTAAVSRLTRDEEAGVGRVKWAVFGAYAESLGSFNFFILISAYVLFEVAAVADNLWMTQWTKDVTPQNSSEYTHVRDYYLGVYGGLGIVQAIFIFIYAMTMALSTVEASRILHKKMLYSILRSPMSFFDTTPSGRILNRFSRDVETIDNVLPELIRNWMNSFFVVLAGLFVIAYSTPIFLVVLIPLMIVYYFLQRFYIPSSRQLKRLESTTRSPIFANFSETISGASTIRAYRQEDRFMNKSNDLVDNNVTYYISNMTANRWLGFRLDIMSGIIVLAAAMFAVLGRNSLSGGIVGLSISYALQCTSELNWIVRVTSDLESNIVSVERVKEYSETPKEAEWDRESTRPRPSWPSDGAVKFSRYSTRYREDLDLVLKDISFSVNPKEKIGIVGRTGAGKSSLTMALFRIIEPVGGEICIDGLSIASLGLHQLRSKLTILPQDPVLFSGTLRFNVDPLIVKSELEIWEALRRAHLDKFVNSLTEGLDYECGEGGLNLSVGQRQLVCLARALLNKTRLLVLDEATAAVDLETDELIQSTIRSEFADSTILTIAHRLNTIMDYDRILVLDKGQVAEFDSPSALLSDSTSIFYGMTKEAGLTA